MNIIEEKLKGVTQFVIRPRRNTYTTQQLGPSCFRRGNRTYIRKDLEISCCKPQIPTDLVSENTEGPFNSNLILQCSLFEEKRVTSQKCLLFMHGNTGNRLMSYEMLEVALDNGLAFACFDFLGCGNSDGDFITLGYRQKDQIMRVIQQICKQSKIKEFILGGRSMGAAAIVMLMKKIYQSQYQHTKLGFRINGLILDSPYCNLQTLFEQTANKKLSFLPSILCGWAISKVDTMITDKLYPKQQISLLNETKLTATLNLPFPVAIIYGSKDQVISLNQVASLFGLLNCDKKLHVLEEQGHDGKRSKHDHLLILNWLSTKINAVQQKKQSQSIV